MTDILDYGDMPTDTGNPFEPGTEHWRVWEELDRKPATEALPASTGALSDAKLADAIAIRVLAGAFRWVPELGWHEWDRQRWRPCPEAVPAERVRRWAKSRFDDAYNNGSIGGDALRAWSSLLTKTKQTNALTMASWNDEVLTRAEELDAHPTLFNTMNGTIDLETGIATAPRPSDRLTRVAGAEFDPEAHSELFDGFIERILPDVEVRAFVQRLLGYALLGTVREHVLPIFCGTGANGKSVLLGTVLAAFGDYGVEVDPELLMSSHNPRHLTFLMQLRGRRLVTCSETERGRAFAESTMKRLVGGDPIQANLMRRDPITFTPTHTLIMSTNHLPKVSGDDPAVWRRLLVVPFDVVIPEAERDTRLPEKLRQPDVLAAVLAWCWAGWLEYQRLGGLAAPDAVKRRTEEYRCDSDALGRFLAEETTENPYAYVGASELYASWSKWSANNGEQPMTQTALGKALAERGHEKRRTNRGFVYSGLGLLAESGPEQ